MKRFWLLLLLLALAAGGSGALAQEAAPDAENWQQISLEGVVCARGTPYSLFVHSGDPEKLMVYFQGGGACWDASTCKQGGTFDDSVQPGELDRYRGIFDFADPANPVADFSVVLIPYCTGDVHTGAQTRRFRDDGTPFTTEFNGFANAQAALAWTFEQFEQPSQLVITGSSAGAYGAVFHAPFLLDHYPDSDALVLGDAGIGVIPPEWNGLATWGTLENVFTGDNYGGVSAQAEFANTLYRSAAQAFPNARFAQFTTAADAVQAGFYLLQGGTGDWQAQMQAHLTTLATLPNFSAYVGWGAAHAILPTPLFYQMQVGGVSFRDWFAALVNDEPAVSVQCEDCETPELVGAS